ncbi:MAG: hypothetical protein ACFFHD_09180, partial [Promethearchaeota archaeon]
MINRQKLKSILLLFMILFTSYFTLLQVNFIDSNIDPDKFDKDSDVNIIPKTSIKGNASWWDKSYRSRQLINITNPYSVNFSNYGVSIEFNYTNFVNTGRMNKSLKDIRIIEYDSNGDPHVRKYYFQQDFPVNDMVTVWFDTNISSDTTEYDTYLYYGNKDAQIDTIYFMNKSSNSQGDNFGWIKNGGFELENKTGTLINDIFGWHWSDDVPNDVSSGYTPNIPGINYQHNLSVFNGQHEQVYKDDFSFKWGDTSHIVSDGGTGNDFIGTLYCTPFLVPKVSGGSIGVRFWRNVRTYDDQNNKYFGYYAMISHYFSTDVNSHLSYPKSIYSQGFVEMWDSLVSDSARKTYVEDHYDVEPDRNTDAGQLTGEVIIDLSEYEGEVIFLEFGMYSDWGDQIGKFAAFGQIDDVGFNYTLSTALNSDAEERMAEVTVIVKDVDGRIVPNAKVSLVNYSISEPIIDTRTTSTDDGSVIFTGVDYDTYDIVVNYTIDYTNNVSVVYNSSKPGGEDFVVSESIHIFEVEADLWTIDFEIVDFDGEPLNYGYIVINNTKGGGFLDNITLDSNGKATFRWNNQSRYYYKVYYDNDDYNLNPTTLNESYIYRETYEKYDKYIDNMLYIKQLNLNTTLDPYFTVHQRVYTNGSLTELGNKKIINAHINISLLNPNCDFDSVRIYYIDKDNSTTGNLIYENTSYHINDEQDIIDIEIRTIESANLKGDSYEIYGLLIEVEGQNSSLCDGIIKINFTETCNIYNVTDLCKVNITIIDSVGAGVAGCIVKVNSTSRDGLFEVELLTKDFTGVAFGQKNDDLVLWYLKGYEYNFSLVFFGAHKDLIVNKSDKPFQAGVHVYFYNYTLTEPTNLIFEIWLGEDTNSSDYQTKFKDFSAPESVIWGQNITIQVNFILTEDNWDSSYPVTPPANVSCHIKTTGPGSYILFDYLMSTKSNGIFNVTFNSSLLSAGNDGKLYNIIISGNKKGYSPPTNFSDSIFIDTVPTILTMHDYYNNLTTISEISQTFGEFINLTVKYYNDTDSPLKGAILTYEWLHFSSIQFYEDPLNIGYYTTTLDTSLAEIWGTKSIKVTAMQENYTTQILYTSIIIIERLTTLNNQTDLVYINSKIWVEDPNPFDFIYQDVLTEKNIGNLTTAVYTWEELYPNGTRIPGVSGTDFLVQNGNNTYTLDFRTEIRPIGFYYLYITLHKENYMAKSALINLEIKSREFNYVIPSEQIINNILTLRNGDLLKLNISLHDLTRDIPLENATVSMMFQEKNYTFYENGNGLYSLEIIDYNRLTEDEISNTTTTSIIISKANFTTQIISITILLKNRIFNISISKPFKDNLIKIISGDILTFNIALNDSYNDTPITDGDITILIGSEVYEDLIITNNGDGTYTITFLSYPEA